MAEFGSMTLSKSFTDALFDKAFGGVVANEEEYYNPYQSVDKGAAVKEALIQKASLDTQTGGPGTAGTALIPVWVDPNIVDRTDKQTPLRNLLRRVAVRGQTYDYIPLTQKGGAQFHAEGGAIAVQVDSYDRESVQMKYLYARGQVTGQIQAANRGWMDMNGLDLRVKAKSVAEKEEDTIINGDVSSNALEFDGLIQLITTNTTDVSGNVTLAGIRAEFAASFNNQGEISLAVTDKSTHNYIKGLLLDIQRQIAQPAEGLPFGIPGAFSFDGVNFIADRFMPTTSTQRRILYLDERYVFMAVLLDMAFEPLAKTLDATEYMMKEYLALVVTHEAACTQQFNIT